MYFVHAYRGFKMISFLNQKHSKNYSEHGKDQSS